MVGDGFPVPHICYIEKYAGVLSAQVALLTGAQLEVPAQQVVQVQRIMEAAYRSNDEKITVRM